MSAVIPSAAPGNKDNVSLLLTVGPRLFDSGRIAVANDTRSSFCFAAIRTLRGAAYVVHKQEAFDV
jgi:hypothetical protein